ncbi:MAG: tubulin-like doman-containing protein [Synechococcales cyanobacterium]
MTPTVIIGLGGTGKEVLLKVRRLIVETYGSLEALPIVSFLHIDTEQNAKASEPQTVLKQDISLRPVEQVWARVEDAKAILNNLSSYDYLAEWFPLQLKGTDSILAGAGQIRALGKFAFTMNYRQIKQAFENAKSRIVGHEKRMLDTWQVQLDKGINILIVCSLSGGTGSGMFLDLAYNLRDWIPASDLPQSSAFLVLPGAFSGLGDRVIANAYAALSELNHYSQSGTYFDYQYSSNISDRISVQASQDVPFNFCYLVGNSNDKVTFPSLNAVLEMVGQNIFLDFSSGFSQYKKLVRDNLRKQWSSPDPLGYPQSFISFGLSSVQFPVERVLNACAARLAKKLTAWWSNPTPTPTAMRDVIQTEILPKLVLAESDSQHQIVDSLSLGENSKPYSKEVANWIIELRRQRNDLNLPFEQLQKFVSDEQVKYDRHFNDSDGDPSRWSDYFRRMWDNYQRLVPQKRVELRDTVAEIVKDRFRGAKFARQFLEVLLEMLGEYRSRFDRDRQKDWIPRERSAANSLQILLKQIDDHARNLVMFNRRGTIDQDFNGIMNALETIYTCKVEIKARTLGVQLLDELQKEVEKLLSDLTKFEKVVENLKQFFSEKENTFIKETGALISNGIMLYDEKDVDRVYQETLGQQEEIKYQAISENVFRELQISLFEFHTFDGLKAQDLAVRLLNACVEEFRHSNQLKISAAQKFIEQFPSEEERQAQIKTAFSKSEPFLRLSQEQVQLGWDNRLEKRQTLIGIQGGTQPTDGAAQQLLPILRQTSTITDKDIRPLNDIHRIYFIQELGAFPLRLIEGMDRMRMVYRAVGQADRNPLHTHHLQQQFADLMPPTLAEMKIRNDFILAQVLGLLSHVQNKVTGFPEVRLEFQDRQTGLKKTQTLGSTLEEAEAYLLNDHNRRMAQILDEQLRTLGQSATTRPEKQQFYQRLMQFLQRQETELPGGKDDPRYGSFERAIGEYVTTFNLYVADAPPTPSPVTSSMTSPGTSSVGRANPVAAPIASSGGSPTPENIEKYRKLVETCYRKGQPSATEQELLQRFQTKYGIPDVLAQELIGRYQPSSQGNGAEAIYEYALMLRSFLENDGEIDAVEHAQLLELQDELDLTNEQVETIERNIREELGL